MTFAILCDKAQVPKFDIFEENRVKVKVWENLFDGLKHRTLFNGIPDIVSN